MPTILTKEQILTLPQLRKDGMTNQEIGDSLNVSLWTISYWFRRLRKSGHKVPKPTQRGGIKKIDLTIKK